MAVSTAALAFPSAIGAGALTTKGGSGGKVCYVDTLSWNTSVVYDASTDSYSGGFYNMFYELDIPSKMIRFLVSGKIVVPTYTTLDFSTKTNNSNITISGHDTNIVFETSYFQIRDLSNLIWRFCSFYNDQTNAIGADVIAFDSVPMNDNGTIYNGLVENIIISNCGFFYGGDECLSITGRADTTSSNGISAGNPITKITVQNCIMAASSKGGIVGSYAGTDNEYTVANNGYCETAYRFPNTVAYGNSQADVINNYTNGFTSRLIRHTGDGKLNVVNNYYKPNPSNVNYAVQRVQYQSSSPPDIWSEGNIIEGRYDTPQSPDFEQWQTFAGSDVGENLPMPENAKASSRHTLLGQAFSILDADQLLDQIVPNIGNNKRIDANGNIIEDEYQLDNFYKDLMINHVEDSSNNTRFPTDRYPTPSPVTVPISTLKDGIPDEWRATNMSGESHDDLAPSGYTWHEEYLNTIDSGSSLNIPVITRTDNNPLIIPFEGVYNPPTGTWTDVEDGSGSATVGGDVVDTSTPGVYNVTLYHTDTDNNTGYLSINYTVLEPDSQNNIIYRLDESQKRNSKGSINSLINRGSLF